MQMNKQVKPDIVQKITTIWYTVPVTAGSFHSKMWLPGQFYIHEPGWTWMKQ